MFILYLLKTGDASERALRRRPLQSVRLVTEPESRNFFKSLFKPLTSQPLMKIYELTFYLQKVLIYANFLSKCELQRRLIWSGLHQRIIGEAIDHVAWTAARLCEN